MGNVNPQQKATDHRRNFRSERKSKIGAPGQPVRVTDRATRRQNALDRERSHCRVRSGRIKSCGSVLAATHSTSKV